MLEIHLMKASGLVPFASKNQRKARMRPVLGDFVNFSRGSATESRIVRAVMHKIPSVVKHVNLLRLEAIFEITLLSASLIVSLTAS
jgi:hypothetical protein